MNSEGLVSIIMPVYNNALYVGEAIDSIVGQTYQDWELIIIDDGSTDNLHDVLACYLENHKIHFIRQENQGPAKARNTGLVSTKGQWIAFLDADDVWLSDKLENQMQYLKKYPDAIVSGSIQLLDCRDGERILTDYIRYFSNFESKKETLTYLLEYPYICAPSTLIFNKNALSVVGMFDETLMTVEDDDLLFRLIRIYPFYCLQVPVTLRRKHEGGITTVLDLESRILNKNNVTKKTLQILRDDELTKSKTDILGYWAVNFSKRHLYCKNYLMSLKWILKGMFLYPQYFVKRFFAKIKK